MSQLRPETGLKLIGATAKGAASATGLVQPRVRAVEDGERTDEDEKGDHEQVHVQSMLDLQY